MLRAVLPAPVAKWLKYHLEFRGDRRLYSRYSGPDDNGASPQVSHRNLEMQITKDYHRIEKGLALPTPKRPFGLEVLARVDRLLPSAAAALPDAPFVQHATSARTALVEWNSASVIDADVAPTATTDDRGISDPRAFFASRHSVRNYSTKEVPQETLEEAVELAINTPSVCNRQPWHVRFYRERDEIETALSFQNGNAGFRHTIPVVALVTVDRAMFAGANERNQVFIDGGLFSMSLVWALHSLGLDSCMLNMSQPHSRMRALRAKLSIPESEAVVMFISIGYPAEGYRVARSPRRAVSEVVRPSHQ